MDVTNALVALKDLLQKLSASLNEEKKQHINLLKELNGYMINSQENIESNVENFLNNIEFSNLIDATNQAQNNIKKQEEIIQFLSQKMQKLTILVDSSITRIDEQHEKMINDIEKNSDDVRAKIVRTISADFKKDVISTLTLQFERSIQESNENALKNIDLSYSNLVKKVEKIEKDHVISLKDFQNHVTAFNTNMTNAIRRVSTTFQEVEKECVNYTHKLVKENMNFLTQISEKLDEQKNKIVVEIDNKTLEIMLQFKAQIKNSSDQFAKNVSELNNLISESYTNTINLMRNKNKEIHDESQKLLQAQLDHADKVMLKSNEIIEVQELVCLKMRKKMNFKFFGSNAILLLVFSLILLICFNFAATYRYYEMNSATEALMNEAYNLRQDNNRLYSIRNSARQLTNNSLAELKKKFPQLTISCNTQPE